MSFSPTFSPTLTDAEFDAWIASNPDEAGLREAYIRLEAKLSDLWTPGHIDSYRRDRHERADDLVARLVRIKFALTSTWIETGQFAGLRTPALVSLGA